MNDLVWVSAYATTRHYGGPEEGGWWYNHSDLIQSIPVEKKDVDVTRLYLSEKHYAEYQHGDIYSVLGGSDLDIHEEKDPGENETKEKPHYE